MQAYWTDVKEWLELEFQEECMRTVVLPRISLQASCYTGHAPAWGHVWTEAFIPLWSASSWSHTPLKLSHTVVCGISWSHTLCGSLRSSPTIMFSFIYEYTFDRKTISYALLLCMESVYVTSFVVGRKIHWWFVAASLALEYILLQIPRSICQMEHFDRGCHDVDPL